MTDTMAERARQRIREEMVRRGLNQSDIAGRLEWGQSRTSKVFSGKTELTVDDLAAICFAVGLSPVEAIRDHGLEFCSEMLPIELRFLERLRQLTPELRESVFKLLHVAANTRMEQRGVTKSTFGRIRGPKSR